MSEPKVIVLRPYAFGDTQDAVVYGATRIAADCGHEAWIAPSSRDLVREQGLLMICTGCMPGGPVDVRTTSRMHDELAAHMGDALSEVMLSTAREMGRQGVMKEFLDGLQENREDRR